jgi:hypothetical protein
MALKLQNSKLLLERGSLAANMWTNASRTWLILAILGIATVLSNTVVHSSQRISEYDSRSANDP